MKVALEDMTERQLMAHIRKIKRQVSKKLWSMTWEEEEKYFADMRRELEEKYGFKIVYSSPKMEAQQAASQ